MERPFEKAPNNIKSAEVDEKAQKTELFIEKLRFMNEILDCYQTKDRNLFFLSALDETSSF